MHSLNVKIIEEVTHKMARELLAFDEPIPDFSTRRPHILESCLATPFQTWDGKSLYPTLVSKASILFYLMIKNHPFENGNKRIAITTVLVFLYLNNKWLFVDNQEYYEFTKWIAASRPQFKEEAVKAIGKFFQKYTKTVPLKQRLLN